MPIFYLIGVIALGVQYVIDRLTLAYFYRLPPMYTELMTIVTLELMSWVPLATLSILFWQYTNRQMFDNVIDPITFENEVRHAHHKVRDIEWGKLNTA